MSTKLDADGTAAYLDKKGRIAFEQIININIFISFAQINEPSYKIIIIGIEFT